MSKGGRREEDQGQGGQGQGDQVACEEGAGHRGWSSPSERPVGDQAKEIATQYNTIQHHTTPYNTIQHHTTPHNTIQHHTTPYNTI